MKPNSNYYTVLVLVPVRRTVLHTSAYPNTIVAE